jgi:hypothetical protein
MNEAKVDIRRDSIETKHLYGEESFSEPWPYWVDLRPKAEEDLQLPNPVEE